MNIDDLLRAVVERGASDLHLKAGTPAVLRINGKLVRYDDGKGVPEFRLSQQDGLPCPFYGGVGAASAEFWDNYFSGKA